MTVRFFIIQEMLNTSEYIKIAQNLLPVKFDWEECEKLLIVESPNPLPLPTLKLSGPPGAVRPDGKVKLPFPAYIYRSATSKFIKQSPIVPITIGIMLLNGELHQSHSKVIS